MKDKIKRFLDGADKVKVLVENKRWKTKYKKLEQLYDLLVLDNISVENEMILLRNELTQAQKQKKEYLTAYKHLKEERRQLRILLMKNGTLSDVKKALGVK